MKRYLLLLSSCFLLSLNAVAEQTTNPLDAALAIQDEATQQRYEYRHPKQTLEFFGIKPDMTVVEALPGGGWYSKILMLYLGKEGNLIGADYSLDMYPLFGFFSEERLEKKKTWVQDWTKEMSDWSKQKELDASPVSAFVFGKMPADLHGTADAVLFIRALHNLNRFEDKGGFLSSALKNAYDVLKPGGIVGIVQHQASETTDDDWAKGQNGYLKKSYLIKRMQQAGFSFVGESPINENTKDQPGKDDIVWRLPPSLSTSKDDTEKKQAYQAIGESNRMTLKFMKPAD